MNKYEKALETLCEAITQRKNIVIKLAIGELNELVEKATPKKPTPKTPRNRERYYCADCGLRLKKSWIACPRCATMIDWSEDTKIL